jgi:RNA polymerase sigma-70 factor (ECF subfamily)
MISSTAGTTCMHRLDDRTDEALVELAVQGEAGSFAMLVARHRHRAIRIAYGIVHNPADAEDAVQDAFIRAYRGLAKFRGAARFSSWIYRIVVNESVRMVRNRHSTVEDVDLDSQCALDEHVDTERVLMVRECLASLPERLRVVLALRGEEELDYSEIAEILGLPVGTVRSRLHEARQLFARRWKEAIRDEV